MHWWIELGYPHFEEGKGRFPRTGQVIKYYREQKKDDKGKPWTQEGLASVLGITKKSVWEIENRDAAMTIERRQFLSNLFNIPPCLLGITTLDEILKKTGATDVDSEPISSTGAINIQEFGEYLATCRKIHATTGIITPMAGHLSRIDALYRELPHTKNKEPIQRFLCEYHRFVAALLRDQMQYARSIEYMDKALFFAESLNDDELQVICLLNLAHTWSDANGAREAVDIANRARLYEDILPGHLNGSLLLYLGPAYARVAETEKERTEAIALLDRGANIVRTTQDRNINYLFDFSLPRYHLNKASALINIGRNKDALFELDLVQGDRVWWTSFRDILGAQAYLNQGNYPMAASYAEAGLVVVKKIDSRINIARVEAIHRQLKESRYRNNPDVARLGYLLGAY